MNMALLLVWILKGSIRYLKSNVSFRNICQFPLQFFFFFCCITSLLVFTVTLDHSNWAITNYFQLFKALFWHCCLLWYRGSAIKHGLVRNRALYEFAEATSTSLLNFHPCYVRLFSDNASLKSASLSINLSLFLF